MAIARTLPFAAVLLATTSLAAQEAPRLERVVLSAAGVAYLDLTMAVDAQAQVALTVPRQQADDILKSLTIYGDAGRLGAVTLGGETSPAELFRDLPIKEADLARTSTLLAKLKGALIRVEGPRAIEGRVLSVESEETRHDQGTTVRQRVTLMTAEGLRSFVLEEVTGLSFVEPETRAMLATALTRLAQTRAEGERTVQIRVDAPPGSAVRLGYLVEAPLWKTSYRAVLAPESARLQAWAIVDNRSGRDWRDIELTLVAGAPVTLKQALARVYMVDRPDVPVRGGPALRPRPDTGATAPAARPERVTRGATPKAAMAGPPTSEIESAALAAMPAPAPDMAAFDAAEPVEAATQTIYRLPARVALANGATAMLPLTDRPLPTERVAVFQPDRHKTNPLAALRVKNDGAVSMPRGILTIYETDEQGRVTFEGDAELEGLPPGDTRLLPFALDAKTRIRVDREQTRRAAGFKVAGGILALRTVDRQTTRYHVEAPEREQRVLVLEHPKEPGFGLASPTAIGETERFWRFERRLAAGERVDLEVVTERPRSEEMALVDLSVDELRLAFRDQELPQALRDAMARIGTARAAVAQAQQAVDKLEREQTAIAADQGRLRANLGSVPKESDLARRYLDRLAQSEDRLEALARQLGPARAEAEAMEAALDALVQKIEL